jgi:hypothetical protein
MFDSSVPTIDFPVHAKSDVSETVSDTVLGAKLFAEVIAALGGEAFLQIKTAKLTGRGEFTTPPQTGGLTVPLESSTLWVAAGGRSRFEARSLGGRMVFLNHGYNKGAAVLLAGRTFTVPAEQADGIEPTEFLRRTYRDGLTVTAVPADTRQRNDDRLPLMRLDIAGQNGTVTRLYIEPATKLPRKLVWESSRGVMTVLLADYRSVGDCLQFGQFELFENAGRILKIQVRETETNFLVRADLFEKV